MPAHFKDYYQVLGISKGAAQEDVRKAFRKLARQHHPDVAKDKKAAEAQFREINEAYEILGDPEKRRKYDEFEAHRQAGGGRRPQGWPRTDMDAGAEDFEEFLKSFMKGQGQGGVGRRQGGTRTPQPQNVETEVHVSVEELVKGARKRVSVRLPGRTSPEVIEVQIPASTVEGSKVRIRGRGLNGGDLHFKVVLLPHAVLKVDGCDLLQVMRLAAWKAVLGATLEVRTPEGTVRLKVPAGTQSGRRFRLGGRGLPKADKTRGDFLVEIQVSVPESLSLEERALWVKLQELHDTRRGDGR